MWIVKYRISIWAVLAPAPVGHDGSVPVDVAANRLCGVEVFGQPIMIVPSGE